MRPRLILLLALLALTITFMGFLVKNSTLNGVTCQKTAGCPKAAQPAQPVESSGGGGEMDNGSFHHLIVSTIK